jgi:very-short-patch-repair endonuclease
MKHQLTKTARALRKRQTPSENKLWQQLRAKRCMGLKFYRQYPIENYIVDFCCPEKRLVVEVDGGGHDHSPQRELDTIRGKTLDGLGFRTIRVWSNEVENNLAGVIEQVQDVLLSPLPQSLSRTGRGRYPIDDPLHQ